MQSAVKKQSKVVMSGLEMNTMYDLAYNRTFSSSLSLLNIAGAVCRELDMAQQHSLVANFFPVANRSIASKKESTEAP